MILGKHWLAAAAVVGLGLTAEAQLLSSVVEGTTTGGLDSFTITLDPNDLAGTFETVELDVVADAGTIFNQDPLGGPVAMLGSDDTGFNFNFIVPDSLPGGFGFQTLNNESDTTLFGTFAKFGQGGVADLAISTSGVLDFAQIVLPSGMSGSGSYTFTAFRNGEVEGTVSGTFGDSVEPIPGDFDGDGDVDGADFGVFVGEFQTGDTGGPGAAAPFSQADLNMSGFVDGADFGIFVDSFQNFPPMSAVAVPEPSVISLVALAIAGAACGRRGC